MHHKDILLAAKISKPKGIRGNFVIKSFLENNDIFLLQLLDKFGNYFDLSKLHSLGKNHFLCKTSKITSRNDAELYKNQELFCKKSDLKDLEEDNFFVEDLLNLVILDSINKEKIGYIKNIFQQKADDIIEIVLFKNKNSKFYIFNKSNFPEITKDFMIIDNSIL
ncbi:MAG: 16S rRNA processing protein RimM [Rickettsia sp.]|nr:16S rRNA processing protein RimM [Rickettsia sp.]